MKTINLGIVAHVDAGKTSLTERLLYYGGVIEELGRVDLGSTQTDSLAQERERGITIKAAVASFVAGDVPINLIDTPGHPDFIAEVERVLSVLDGAVLVLSAVEGVQSQTRVLMRVLQRLKIPTLIFINKVDRAGANCDAVLHGIRTKLTNSVVAMGSAHQLGQSSAQVAGFELSDRTFRTQLTELLAEHDDGILGAYVERVDGLSEGELLRALASQTARGLVHPVYFGSAATGAGVELLVEGIVELLSWRRGDEGARAFGLVFKVERGPMGQKIAYVRMFEGCIRVRDWVDCGQGRGGRVTAIEVFDRGRSMRQSCVVAGQIGKLSGLTGVGIGDAFGACDSRPQARHFAPPTLEAVIVARHESDRMLLHGALKQLAEQDPLINLRQDDTRQELFVSLYGEVQKEVIQDTLARDFGVEVDFKQTTTICIERPRQAGSAVERLKEGETPFLATIGLRVEPAAIGSGVAFRLEVEAGSLPYAFLAAVEVSARQTLSQGLHGWPVTDCAIILTHSGYLARQSHSHAVFDKSMSSTARDFRDLTPLVLMDALKRAGTDVCEPIHRFELEIPSDCLRAVLPVVTRLAALQSKPVVRGPSCVLEGTIAAACIHGLQQRLPTLTGGDGVFDSWFDRYDAVRGDVPERPRTDHEPTSRERYLLNLRRPASGISGRATKKR